MVFPDILKIQIARPDFHFGVPKRHKVATNEFHIKDTGTSSSRKLCRAIYHTLYRMDAKKTH